ncbi:Transcriptional regulator PerR [Methanimicrococcus hongohii]|uniref:Transcriptional regulator PerR n=1 Tax=Methanimicrococcus hongohii TaxID=3028295 RepID=A0AA97A171_9EURY|nr:transcriptional repressor [Methanimicrococcus sp. Hf6]WNY23003.1 Transcriptional regulator PerR [Methanimicrococcus sp. Hf6]
MIKRNTVQKMKIMEYLMSTKSHPTAEAVYAEVSKDIPTISLSTVYRNLNTMAEDGEILKFEVGNEAHFDADISFHHHVYCKVCKSVFDLHDTEIADYIKENAKIPNFKIESTNLIFVGRCCDCIPQEEMAQTAPPAAEEVQIAAE